MNEEEKRLPGGSAQRKASPIFPSSPRHQSRALAQPQLVGKEREYHSMTTAAWRSTPTVTRISEKLSEVTLFGRKLGTCFGWDMTDESVYVFYDFTPYTDVPLPSGDVFFDLPRGLAETYDDDGNVMRRQDFIHGLRNVTRTEDVN